MAGGGSTGSSSGGGGGGGGGGSVTVSDAIRKMWQSYNNEGKPGTGTGTGRLKLVDTYLLFVLLTGIVQFLYCCLVGSFPFNSFLSGFISTVSCFVLGVCLRLQVNPENKSQFRGISPERGYADFIFAHVILHLVVMNFIG